MLIDIDEPRLIVISDLHVGNPFSLATSRLASFVDYVVEQRCALVINGDGVDILQGRLRNLVVQSLDVANYLHQVQRAGLNVYYVVGNHDTALEHALSTWLGDHLSPFLNVTSGALRVRVEHGHVYDPLYVLNPRLYDAAGRAAAPLLRLYPDLYRLVSASTRFRTAVRRWRKLPMGSYDAAEQHAADMISNRGFDVVVFGHTHRAEHVTLPTGGAYLNSGNWLRGSSFVEITDGTARLMEWDDAGTVPRAVLVGGREAEATC